MITNRIANTIIPARYFPDPSTLSLAPETCSPETLNDKNDLSIGSSFRNDLKARFMSKLMHLSYLP
jgi:hypothetical protein